jgi:quinolinate synthase
MVDTFNKNKVSYLVDFETNTILNYGETNEMVDLMDQSHGNLFVVSYENLNAEMKQQLQGEK